MSCFSNRFPGEANIFGLGTTLKAANGEVALGEKFGTSHGCGIWGLERQGAAVWEGTSRCMDMVTARQRQIQPGLVEWGASWCGAQEGYCCSWSPAVALTA